MESGEVAGGGHEQGVQLVGDDLSLVGSAAGAIFQGGRSGCRSSSAVEEPDYQNLITFDYVVD